MIKKKIKKIHNILKKKYTGTKPLLNYKNPYELLIATILAAQCTDEQVNKVTPRLFSRFPDPGALGRADLTELEEIIHSTGFYVNKAKNIKKTGTLLTEKFESTVPSSIVELVTLPGVGRKTANVLAGVYFNKPAVIVDTHFKRVCRRIGLTSQEDPGKIETELRELVPEAVQTSFSMEINRHGRQRCKARKPDCVACEIEKLCDYTDKWSAKMPGDLR